MIEGKIANQAPNRKLNSGYPRPVCGKCQKLIDNPSTATLANVAGTSIFTIHSYLETSHWIYESKSGSAVVYCSKYCRNKHNHRFNK